MKIAVIGAKGRVGKITAEIARRRGHEVLEIDKDTKNELNVKIDTAIDFTTADATDYVIKFCVAHRCNLVTGVTGRTAEQEDKLDELGKKVKVVKSANFSQGVDMLGKLCETALTELKNWDCEIVETHRKGKLDAPSGTAKTLAATACKAKGGFSTVTVHSVRAGSNYGKHEIILATDGESITITHQAENAEIFARGAVIQAEKMQKQ